MRFAGILLFWDFTVKWRIIDIKSGGMGVKMGVNNSTHNIPQKLYLYLYTKIPEYICVKISSHPENPQSGSFAVYSSLFP